MVAMILSLKLQTSKYNTPNRHHFLEKWYKPEISPVKIQCEICQKPEKECLKEGCDELYKVQAVDCDRKLEGGHGV